MKLLKKRVPFLAIAHKHWDLLSDDILGGNVSFADPVSEEFLTFPSFLEPVSEKKSAATARLVRKCFSCVVLRRQISFKVPMTPPTLRSRLENFYLGNVERALCMPWNWS